MTTLCLRNCAICHWKLKNFVEAISKFKKFLQVIPRDKTTQVYLGEVLIEAGEFDEAEEGNKHCL